MELSLDLRSTPPDKVLNRLFGALERVGEDVTLLVLLRDTPEYAGVVASAYQALQSRGYVSDSSRFPAGGQRLRVQRRRDPRRAPPPGQPPALTLVPRNGAGAPDGPGAEPSAEPVPYPEPGPEAVPEPGSEAGPEAESGPGPDSGGPLEGQG